MRKSVVILALLAFGSLACAQNLGGAILGVFDDGLGQSVNVEIPNYGLHAVVQLTTAEVTPARALGLARPVFEALAALRDGVVSVSIHASPSLFEDEYVLILQKAADGVVTAYLNGDELR